MGIEFKGKLLQPPRIAQGNAVTTGEPLDGVPQATTVVPNAFSAAAGAPPLVAPSVHLWNTLIADGSDTSTEWLVWANRSANLTVVENSNWFATSETGIIPNGSLTVSGNFSDGSGHVLVQATGNHDLSAIQAVVVARGDVSDYSDEGWNVTLPLDVTQGRKGSKPYLVLLTTAVGGVAAQDPIGQIVTLTNGQKTTLDGGLSIGRNDKIIEVIATRAQATFWWTRNDTDLQRFGWDGKSNRWQPLKGLAPKDLGMLPSDGGTFVLDPAPIQKLGDVLVGNSNIHDALAILRLGPDPSSASVPIGPDTTNTDPWTGIHVIADNAVVGHVFVGQESGVVGQTNGKLRINPAYALLMAGRHLWYSPDRFPTASDGILGEMLSDTNLYLAPVPNLTDRPLLRFGSRAWLGIKPADNDAALQAMNDPGEGFVGVSLSSGKLRLALADLAKADTTSQTFNQDFLDEVVIYDGVALGFEAQPVCKPVQLVDANGAATIAVGKALWLPNAEVLATTFAGADAWRGLGVSGVLEVPDGTGAALVHPELVAPARAGGDQTGDVWTGRVRSLDDGIGEGVFFSPDGAILDQVLYMADAELPSDLDVPCNTIAVSMSKTTHGSKVVLPLSDAAAWSGKPLWFVQTTMRPSIMSFGNARLVSRRKGPFSLLGTEILHLYVNNTAVHWHADTLFVLGTPTYSTAAVAASLQAAMPNGSTVVARAGFLVIQPPNPATDALEVAWGPGGGVLDTSGAAALGFGPGWKVKGGTTSWLSDAGVAIGLRRSPVNLDRKGTVPDVIAVGRIDDTVIQAPVLKLPYISLQPVPLQDRAGYDVSCFLAVAPTSLSSDKGPQLLTSWKDVVPQFGSHSRAVWTKTGTAAGQGDKLRPLHALDFGVSSVLPSSLATVVGGEFQVAPDGGVFVPQTLGTDFEMPNEGASGIAVLTERYGKHRHQGARGSMDSNGVVFSDPDAKWISWGVQPGWRLRLIEGSLEVVSVSSETAIHVAPALPIIGQNLAWDLFEGEPNSVFDPMVLADVQWLPFNHLTTEPFEVRVLSPLGTAPLTENAPRLQANVASAIKSGRPLGVRWGFAPESVSSTVTFLGSRNLGVLSDSLLIALDDPRWATKSFSLRLGLTVIPSISILKVGAFSQDPAIVEVLTSNGQFKFSSALMANHAFAQVFLVDEFLPANAVPNGTIELNPSNGYLNLPTNKLGSGLPVFLVETLRLDKGTDGAMAPLAGAVSLKQPLRAGQSLEVAYWQADLEGRKIGNQIVEALPSWVREDALPDESDTSGRLWRFNADGRRWDALNDPIVFVGSVCLTHGDPGCTIEWPDGPTGRGRLRLLVAPLQAGVSPSVSFAVLDASGGEMTFQTLTTPVYRPPFFVRAGTSKIPLWGDRTSDLKIGMAFQVGKGLSWIKSISYNATSDVSLVTVHPPTLSEAGSRAPGVDTGVLVSSIPIIPIIDPDGDTPIVVATAPGGLMQAVPWNVFPFDAVTKGQTVVTFLGDLTAVAGKDHVIDIGGNPFIVVSAILADTGDHTFLTLASPAAAAIRSIGTTVHLSVRPIWPYQVQDIQGPSNLLAETRELVLWLPNLPGKTLQEGTDWTVAPATGLIHLRDPLPPQGRLLLAYGRGRELAPIVVHDQIILPRWKASFLYAAPPDTGGTLRAKYAFHAPDSFLLRAALVSDLAHAASQQAAKDAAAGSPAGGLSVPSPDGGPVWTRGRYGVLGQVAALASLDGSARAFLSFYDEVISAFEQVTETAIGDVVGDRDGKIRLWVGRGKWPVPPGWEDPFVGVLVPRDVHALWFNANVKNGTSRSSSDFLIDPATATVVNGRLLGTIPNTQRLHDAVQEQAILVRNDVDDQVLLGAGHLTKTYAVGPKSKLSGVFARTSERHALSRLFPTVARTFFHMLPGIGADETTGDDGVYTWLKLSGGKLVSTTGNVIGKLTNPTIGAFGGVRSANLHHRRARARIWQWCPDGLVAGALGDINNAPSNAVAGPCLVAVPVPFSQIDAEPVSGLPHGAAFASNGGTGRDLVTGDPELAIPGFKKGDVLAWGFPDGRILPMQTVAVSWFGSMSPGPVLVHEVLMGCVVTFADKGDNLIPNAANVLVGTDAQSGIAASEWPIQQGATLLVIPAKMLTTDPPLPADFADLTPTQAAKILAARDMFRVGMDYGLDSDGSLRDMTEPSLQDPSLPIQQLTGQRPPLPSDSLEGTAEISLGNLELVQIPALLGKALDDSGDRAVPFLGSSITELDRLSNAANRLADVVDIKNGNQYIYPDEIVADGRISSASATWGLVKTEPATLILDRDIQAVTHGNTTHGLGDATAGDLVFVEVGQSAIGVGGQGILSIGRLETRQFANGQWGSLIEPPRFVTATTPTVGDSNLTNSPVRYKFDNAIVHLNDPITEPYPNDPQANPPSGVYLMETATKTILDFSSITLALNDGATTNSGNLVSLWSNGTPNALTDDRRNNTIRIQLIARTDSNITTDPNGGVNVAVPQAGHVVLDFTIQGNKVRALSYLSTGGFVTLGGGDFIRFGVTDGGDLGNVLDNKQIVIPVLGILDFQGANANARKAWWLPHTLNGGTKRSIYGYEFSISIDTYNSQTFRGRSVTAWIASDRLTFHEVWDARLIRKRGTTHPLNAQLNLAGNLSVYEVTCGGNLASIVNRDINGTNGLDADNNPAPVPLTFLARSTATGTLAGGTWTSLSAGVSPETGTIRAMAFEGVNNTPLVASKVRVAVVPSSALNETTTILTATGMGEAATDSTLTTPPGPTVYADRIVKIAPTGGTLLASVLPGDLVVIDKSIDASHQATTKAGTYVVRHTVVGTANLNGDGALDTRLLSPAVVLGSGGGFVPVQFPRVASVTIDNANNTQLDLTHLADFPGTSSGFAASGRVYIVRSVPDLASATNQTKLEAVISADYQSIQAPARLVNLSNFRYSDSSFIPGAFNGAVEFKRLVNLNKPSGGHVVSGMAYLPVSVGGKALGLPDTGAVGIDQQSANKAAVHGFHTLTLGHSVEIPAGLDVIFNGDITAAVAAGTGPIRHSGDALVAGSLLVLPKLVQDATVFGTDTSKAPYPSVPGQMSLENLTNAQWQALTNTVWVRCLLPGMTFTASFYAQAGIFLEPSCPRPTFDLSAAHAHLVDRTHNLTSGEIGFRDFKALAASGTAIPTTPEEFTFRVRRIRRWHTVQDGLSDPFKPLRFAYEIRRGIISSFAVDSRQRGTVHADAFTLDWDTNNPTKPGGDAWNEINTPLHDGTQLGGFLHPDVNAQPGDELRVLDENGKVIDRADIEAIPLNWVLRLGVPGLVALPTNQYAGKRFEIWLRHAPVPHEQSCEQLLDQVTSKEIWRTLPNRATDKGGWVPAFGINQTTWALAANRLQDDLFFDGSGPTKQFSAIGVKVGDIVLVDPSGRLPMTNGLPSTQEAGMRPFGDISIPERAVHVAGGPNSLDDNRGFYRVTKIVGGSVPRLEVTGLSSLFGGKGSDVKFPTNQALLGTYGFSLLPTVTGSVLNTAPYAPGGDGTEGQNDLRPTRLRDATTKSYSLYSDPINDPGAAYSIRPFGYRIIRPTSLLSKQAVDLALFIRERTLSMLDAIRNPSRGLLSGGFLDMMDKQHLESLATLTDPVRGLGVWSNALVELAAGRVITSPYANGSDCLSILDRRFWLGDKKLDSLEPLDVLRSQHLSQNGTAYTKTTDTNGAQVRPFLPDRIRLTLDTSDKLRPARLAWLNYRTHAINGTLASLVRLKASIPDKMAIAKNQALLAESAGKIE